MDSVSPQDVYARHLVSRRGYPLWTPEPSMTLPDVYRQQGLKIGDVGVVVPDDGSFDVFFNICMPATHSLHRQTGVPNNFTPVQLEDRDIAIFPEVECAGRIISTSSVTRLGTQSSEESTARSAQPGPLNYEFTLSSKEGALLILPEGAERYYLRNQRPFLEEAIQHAVDWYNFAEQRLGRIISHDSLYLITGFYKARSWSLASYQHASGTGGVYAHFKAAQVDDGNISTSYTWETSHTLDWRVGPSSQYYNGIANQSIFIQGFKTAVRSSILGRKRVKVKAQPPVVRPQQGATYYGFSRANSGARLPSSWFSASAANTSRETDADSDMDILEESFDSDSTRDNDGNDITIQHIPEVPKPFHPSDIINQHLLQLHPSAVIAITHDTRWTEQLHSGFLTPEDMWQEGILEGLVHSMSPESQEGVVYLQSITFDDNAELNTSNNETVVVQEESPILPVKKYDAKQRQYVDRKSRRPDAVTTKPRKMPNAAGSEVLTSPSSSSPAPQGTVEFVKEPQTQKEQVSPSSIPRTPKLPKISLPEEQFAGPSRPATRADTRRPQTPAMMPSFSRANPIAGRPALPLKSILKGRKNAQPHDSYESEGEILTAKKVARSQYNIPNVLPPGSRLVPTKQPAFNLHWQLLPYNPHRSKRFLRFDVAFPVDDVVFQDGGIRTKLSDAELDRRAANDTVTRMLITFEHEPFYWEVDVKNTRGICCRDVFEAIYKGFNEQLTTEEQSLVRDRRAVADAFRLRCSLSPGLPAAERSSGWKRVDILLHRTIFLGLTQPKSSGDWVLNLGTPPHIPDSS